MPKKKRQKKHRIKAFAASFNRFMKRLFAAAIVVILVLSVLVYLNNSGYISLPAWFPTFKAPPYEPDGLAHVHFIDVGQGDCSLLVADDGTTMLIDCGEAEYSPRVLRYIDRRRTRRRFDRRLVELSRKPLRQRRIRRIVAARLLPRESIRYRFLRHNDIAARARHLHDCGLV